MDNTLAPDVTQFIQEELAAGHYANEQEVVQEAVRFFRESRTRYRQLREEIHQSIADLDAGHGTVIETDEELTAFFQELKAEVHRELGK